MSDILEIMRLIREQHQELMLEAEMKNRGLFWPHSKRAHQIDGASKALADLACRVSDWTLSKAQ